MLESCLNELNKIVQLDIYYKIDDNLLNVDIYIDNPYNEEICNDVIHRLHHYLDLSYKEINNNIIHLSFYTLINDSNESFIHRIKENERLRYIKDYIYFGNIDLYLHDKNILVKIIHKDKYILILEFTNDVERQYVYNNLSKYNLKIDIKDNYYKYKCKSIKIIKEANNDRDMRYFLSSDYVFDEY